VQPVEFINVLKTDESKNDTYIDDDSVLTHGFQSLIGDSTIIKYGCDDESKVYPGIPDDTESELMSADKYHEDKVISVPSFQYSMNQSQPSLTQTYDSGYDSASADPISVLISNDEFSINSNKIKYHKRMSKKSSSSARNLHKNSFKAQSTFVEAYRKRKGKKPLVVSCIPDLPSTASTATLTSSASQNSESSERLREMKTRLRSLEFQYKHQRHKPKRSITSVSAETSSNASSLTHETLIDLNPMKPCRYEGVSLKESIMETFWEIIGINVLLYILYVIFSIYKDTLSEAMQGGNIPLSY